MRVQEVEARIDNTDNRPRLPTTAETGVEHHEVST